MSLDVDVENKCFNNEHAFWPRLAHIEHSYLHLVPRCTFMRGDYLAYSPTSRDTGTRKDRSHVRRWAATETIHMMINPSAMRMQFAIA